METMRSNPGFLMASLGLSAGLRLPFLTFNPYNFPARP